jgi:hypothetical protein
MNWIKNLLSEGDAVSSKRFIGLIGAFVLLTMLVVNSFSPQDHWHRVRWVSECRFGFDSWLFWFHLFG